MKTKQKILEAALKVLMEDGFTALTQTRVAEAAGVGQGHLTYHFPTRSDLLKAVVDESKARLVNLRSDLPSEKLTLDKLKDLLISFALSQTFPRLMLAITVAADEDATLSNWFVHSDLEARQSVRALLADQGLTVDESALHILRATVIGASIIHLQQNTDASEKTARMVIGSAFQTLIASASPLTPSQP